MTFKHLIKYLVGWRLIILAIALVGVFTVALREGYTLVKPGFKPIDLLNMWSNFDGQHYLSLAQFGYGAPQTNALYAFFPVYPWLIRSFNAFHSYVFSGLLISHVCLFFALFFLYKLIRLDYSDSLARTTIFLMIIFPTSFFFGSVYTESFFLLVSVISFYFMRRNKFLLACLFALVASATRLTGVFLWPAIAIEFWLVHGKNIKKMLLDPRIFSLFLPPIGLLAFMRYQLMKTGDALYFVHSQPSFGANREVDKIILLHQVFFRYAKMLLFINNRLDPLFFTVLLELICGTLFLVLIISAFRRLRLSYAVYAFLSYFLPTLTGTFSSMPRYVLVIFPGFLILGMWLKNMNTPAKHLYVYLSILLGIISIILFTRGYFVA